MEVFEGLNRRSNDFNPKNKHNASKQSTAPSSSDAKAVTTGNTEFRFDKRFSASPLSASLIPHSISQKNSDVDNCDEL